MGLFGHVVVLQRDWMSTGLTKTDRSATAAGSVHAMFPAARRRRILELVEREGAISLRHLAEATETSEVTVRRDLRQLESEGRLVRQRGGAEAAPSAPSGSVETTGSTEPTYAEKTRVAAVHKNAIAARAATLISPGDAIVIGAGTTTHALAQRIANLQDVAVVTNSILVAEALAASTAIDVTLTGGSLRGPTFALVGPAAESSLGHIHAERLFISGNGLTAARGLTTPNPVVASMDRALVAAAREVVVLVDHTKIGHDTMALTVPTESITTVITDADAAEGELDALRAAGLEVIVAQLPTTIVQ